MGHLLTKPCNDFLKFKTSVFNGLPSTPIEYQGPSDILAYEKFKPCCLLVGVITGHCMCYDRMGYPRNDSFSYSLDEDDFVYDLVQYREFYL